MAALHRLYCVCKEELVFGCLGPFKTILVTGPQRSGTTICAKMIAHDLGIEYIDEGKFGIDNLFAFKQIVDSDGSKVIQAPGLCKSAHIVAGWVDMAVILMRRPIGEIVKSELRIGWEFGTYELVKYGLDGGVISTVKYNFWDGYQRFFIQNLFEIEYDDLSSHPLWVPKDARVNFQPKQTEVSM